MTLTPEAKRLTNNAYYSRNSVRIQEKRESRKNTDVRGRLTACLGNARQRSKVEGYDCDIDLDYLCDLWRIQEGKCALTYEELTLEKEKKRWSSSLVSIDRIDNNRGYTKGNVWLVMTKVNFAKGTQSLEEFVEMCKKVIINHG